MSSSRSDLANNSDADPKRPSDHIDAALSSAPVSPKLGVIGWIRWGWRQLTSMRTALVLLLLLAIAAIPGSIFPQRMANPNGVTQWRSDNPDLFPILDALQLFDVYQSAWFSAIYLLLFISLIGCILPRTKHHFAALRSKPPRTPARLSRLADFRSETVAGIDADEAITLAEKRLRKQGYRVSRYRDGGSTSVSAERGYLRETGNLVFHASLVGILVTVGVGGQFAYTGQSVIIEGTTFVNTLLNYSSMNRGRLVSDDALAPYSMTLDTFDVDYVPYGEAGRGQAMNFSANVTIREPDGSAAEESVRVNHPLRVHGDAIYLLGNGYAPTITVRNGDDDIVFRDHVPFLPQDSNMTSLGVIKVTDGLEEQMGLVGFFYPTQNEMETGAFTSIFGDLLNPVVTLNVFEGDLGIDDGTPRSVYALDTSDMEQLTGGDTEIDSIELSPGQTAELPGGRGSVTFEDETPEDAEWNETGYTQSVKRFASLQIHHDRSTTWVLVFSTLAVAGLMTALWVPRRRLWVKATPTGEDVTLEYAGLARGEDPAIRTAVDHLATGHSEQLRS
ncbi:cytochrome c biogenesis protein ResB [Microbacterium amylolyticum]|uniref:cytochrome c biogenesis protein ResB n=1 Tax=Microbacterium amylolyticum TaxID=936337 RepID=UPI0013ECFA8B|nr:cytochrome c biogenesis protein ResB [Microbacterium amylolyticum]